MPNRKRTVTVQARDLTLGVGRLADPDLDLRTQLLHGDRHDLPVAAWVARHKRGLGFLHASRLAALYGTRIGDLVHLFLYVFVYEPVEIRPVESRQEHG